MSRGWIPPRRPPPLHGFEWGEPILWRRSGNAVPTKPQGPAIRPLPGPIPFTARAAGELLLGVLIGLTISAGFVAMGILALITFAPIDVTLRCVGL